MNRASQLAAAAGAFLALAAVGRAAPTIDVTINRNQVYLGESVLVTVKISNAREISRPDLSAIRSAEVEFLDSQRQDYQQIVQTARGFQRTSFHGQIFTYKVTPQVVGTIRLGPITAEAAGETLSSKGQVIKVQGIEAQDVVLLEIVPSRAAVLVDEPFTIALNIMIKQPDAKAPTLSPLDPSRPPQLSVPFLDQTEIAGLDTPDLRKLLGSLVASARNAPGFAINEYTLRRDPFDMNNLFDFDRFETRQPAKFKLEQRNIRHDGKPYLQYRLALDYNPREEGNYTFGPAVFKGTVATGRDGRGMVLTQNIFAVGPACTVRVVPPPEEGRPDSYIGAIGTNLQVTAALDTQTCNVGDPLTLSLSISGNVRMENLYPPILSLQSGLGKQFRIYEDTIETHSAEGAKVYSLTLRPTRGGTLELPPINVSYFDTRLREYRTVKTQPIPLRVRETTSIGQDTVIETSSDRADRPDSALAMGGLAMAPIDLSPSGASYLPLTILPWQLMLALAGPLVCGVVAGARASSRWLTRRLESVRKRNVYVAARHCLLVAGNTKRDLSADDIIRVWSVLRGYFANRLGLAEAGLTPHDIRPRLLERGIPADTVTRLADFTETCFSSGFSNDQDPPQGLRDECRQVASVLHDLEEKLRPRKSRRTPALTLWLWLTLIHATLAGADVMTERWFLWEAANAHVCRAVTVDDFAKAARMYGKLVDSGARSGPLFHNLGTTLLMAHDYDGAVTALLRAERYSGSAPEIRRNLLIALRKQANDERIALPWYRAFLAWHYGLAVATRITLTCIAFTLCWGACLLRLLRLRQAARPLFRIALVGLAVFASSVAASWHQEVRDDAAWHADATAPQSGQEGQLPPAGAAGEGAAAQ